MKKRKERRLIAASRRSKPWPPDKQSLINRRILRIVKPFNLPCGEMSLRPMGMPPHTTAAAVVFASSAASGAPGALPAVSANVPRTARGAQLKQKRC